MAKMVEELVKAIEDQAIARYKKRNGWIPITEKLPDDDKYILISFANFSLADIGRYEVDDDGGGAFYPGDDERSFSSYGLFVNAWMPLPESYKEPEGVL